MSYMMNGLIQGYCKPECLLSVPHDGECIITGTIIPTDAEQFEQKVNAVYAAAEDLLLKKHRDYGPKNISLSPGGPLNGLRVRLHDKFARINHLVDAGATPENESLRDSFLDAANYCMIALLVLDGSWPEG